MIRNILLDAYGTLLLTGNGSVRAAGEILAGCGISSLLELDAAIETLKNSD